MHIAIKHISYIEDIKLPRDINKLSEAGDGR